MNDEQLVSGSPAELIEKTAHSPVTWMNPGSQSAKAPNSGQPEVEAISHEPSNRGYDEKKNTVCVNQNEVDA